mmetsp:Transcript_130767/g.419404  ORF Transcript_130767/g.419404 Transcript_130767/m.419404 type:complete len:404 (+) Transcript_130767:1108-2319(+)
MVGTHSSETLRIAFAGILLTQKIAQRLENNAAEQLLKVSPALLAGCIGFQGRHYTHHLLAIRPIPKAQWSRATPTSQLNVEAVVSVVRVVEAPQHVCKLLGAELGHAPKGSTSDALEQGRIRSRVVQPRKRPGAQRQVEGAEVDALVAQKLQGSALERCEKRARPSTQGGVGPGRVGDVLRREVVHLAHRLLRDVVHQHIILEAHGSHGPGKVRQALRFKLAQPRQGLTVDTLHDQIVTIVQRSKTPNCDRNICGRHLLHAAEDLVANRRQNPRLAVPDNRQGPRNIGERLGVQIRQAPLDVRDQSIPPGGPPRRRCVRPAQAAVPRNAVGSESQSLRAGPVPMNRNFVEHVGDVNCMLYLLTNLSLHLWITLRLLVSSNSLSAISLTWCGGPIVKRNHECCT